MASTTSTVGQDGAQIADGDESAPNAQKDTSQAAQLTAVEHQLTDKFLEKLIPDLAQDETVMQSIRRIRDLQNNHDEVFREYVREKQLLEERYEKMFTPLFAKRKEELDKGHVADFWVRCFENCEILNDNVTAKDLQALQFLEDVSCETVSSHTTVLGPDQKPLASGSFILKFKFQANPFFTNQLLTKTYAMGEDSYDDFPEATGCVINWRPGKDLTKRVFRKRAKGGAFAIKTEPTDSFFNFFSPQDALRDVNDDDIDLKSDLENIIEADVELGEAIRNDLIPRALYYYLDIEDNDDDDDDEEDEDEDEDDDGEDDDADDVDDVDEQDGEDVEDDNDDNDGDEDNRKDARQSQKAAEPAPKAKKGSPRRGKQAKSTGIKGDANLAKVPASATPDGQAAGGDAVQQSECKQQ